MCGIVGYVGKGDRETLERMSSRLVHRGPDDDGVWTGPDVGLGFRRLSVIDLADGRQPMASADGKIRLVFNGEIYNFKELREELEGKYRFTTRSDTEVVLHLYEELGEKAFERLWGMFAIAVWDDRTGRLILARDRLGKKPLYVSRRPDGLVFASEMKALAEHQSVGRRLDLGAISSYFANDWLPAPRTAFEGVEQLMPAHYGVWRGGRWTTTRYWDVESASAKSFPGVPEMDEAAALDVFDGLLKDAVRRRLVADVPVGIFLSGGVDSSLIAAYASDVAGKKIRTFGIGFSEASFDETAYATEVAGILGTEHAQRRFDVSESLASFEAISAFLDEPFADPSVLPTHLLSKVTREHATVALSGDGGDELFWGYGTFKAHRLADALERLPRPLLSAAAGLAKRLPVSDRYMSLPFVAERFFRGIGLPTIERDRAWRSTVSLKSQERLFLPEAMDAVRAGRVAAPSWENDFSRDSRKLLAASYLFDYLPNDILYKADRASMAASLEVRSPLLDHRIAEFAWRLPPSLKLRGFTAKYLMKRLLERRLPKRLVHRRKQGFAIPTAAWLRGPLRERCETYFSKSFQERVGLFQQATIDRWWKEHLDRRRDHRKCLWSLLMFCQWQERWMR